MSLHGTDKLTSIRTHNIIYDRFHELSAVIILAFILLSDNSLIIYLIQYFEHNIL